MRRRSGRSRSLRTVVIAAALGLASASAEARTCTIDVADLREIHRLARTLAKDHVVIDKDRAKAAGKLLLRSLEGGSLSLDPNDWKGIVGSRGKPSRAVVQQLVTRVQRLMAACDL